MLLLTPFEDSAEAYARKYSLRSKFQWKEEEEFLWNMWKEDKFWDSIWKHTVVKNQTIATNGTTSLEAGDLRIHLRNVVENKQIIATSVTMLVHNMAILESIWNTQRRKVKQMQPVWFCIYSGRQFEETFEDPQWRKVKQMQPVWFCILSGRQFEDTFENTQWRKAKQMQPMWFCILSDKQSEDAFENAQWRKIKQMQPVWLYMLPGK